MKFWQIECISHNPIFINTIIIVLCWIEKDIVEMHYAKKNYHTSGGYYRALTIMFIIMGL